MSCWRRRTTLEKVLIIVIAVLSVLVIGFTVKTIITAASKDKSGANELRSLSTQLQEVDVVNGNDSLKVKICISPACYQTASKILKNMNKHIDPCDNIYEFACGSFLKNTQIPNDKTHVNTDTTITDQLYQQLRTLLAETIKAGEFQPFVFAKRLYQACVNRKAIEARGEQPLLDLLRRLGGWPVLEGASWDDTTFSWEASVYKFRSAGCSVDYFLQFSVGPDFKDATKNVINLDQANLELDREFLNRGISDKMVKSYYDYMVDIAVLLGADRTRAETELRDSLQFEIKLANISLPLEERRDDTILYNPMTIRTLQQEYPSIPWLDYINQILAPKVQVSVDEIINIKVPTYFYDLELLLASTSKRTLANYAMWRAVSASMPYLTDKFRRRQQAHTGILYGNSERESTWMECVKSIEYSMCVAVSAMYVRKYFDEKSKLILVEMLDYIRQQFRKILTEVDWMDDVTRKYALRKADAMLQFIAYPNEMLDDRKLAEFYQGLQISSDNLMESMLKLTVFNTNYLYWKLREPVDRADWRVFGRNAYVNAYYKFDGNSIYFPAGFLQGGYFSPDRPAYMNFGGIGVVIGHEMTHGFDDKGRRYDHNGNLVEWWQVDTKNKYLEKVKCIIDQYSNYTIPEIGLNVDGIFSQGENIADNGGVKEAYYAYQAWILRNGEELRLPGLEKYTPNQMFWLSFANTHCATFRTEMLKLIRISAEHAPHRFRVVGSLSNMEEFTSDFKCPPGSNMNPVHKCQVW